MTAFQTSLVGRRTSRSLLSLPTELLLKILSYLPGLDLTSAMLVASPFYQLVSEHTELQYALACHKYAVVDCALPGDDGAEQAPAALRHERLLEMQENWEELSGVWQKIPLPEDFFISDLQGGIFARGTYAADAQPTEPSGIKLHHLPTSSTPASEHILPNLDFGEGGGGTFMDLAIDPGQDILVVIRQSSSRPTSLREVLEPTARSSYELLLLDMAGRPKSKVDRLEMDVRTLYPPIAASAFPTKDARPLLHILGDTLAVMIGETDTMERDCIFAWNWRTGEKLCEYFYERPSVLVSFCLLTPQSFLMTGFDLRSSTPLLTLYAFAGAFGDTLALSPHQPWPIRQCELPRLKADCFHTSVVCLDVRSETAVSTGPKLHGRLGGPDERLFTADPRRGMVVVDLEAGRRLFHAHFLRSSLINHLERALTKPPTFVRRTGWERWGSDNCHLAEVAIERACVNYSHGYRVVVSEPVPPSDSNPQPPHDLRWIALTDYNPLLLSSSEILPDDGEVDNYSWTLHEFPTVLVPGEVWRKLVESRLRRRTRVLGGADGKGLPCEAVMIDEERLIVCSAASENEPRTFHIMAM